MQVIQAILGVLFVIAVVAGLFAFFIVVSISYLIGAFIGLGLVIFLFLASTFIRN